MSSVPQLVTPLKTPNAMASNLNTNMLAVSQDSLGLATTVAGDPIVASGEAGLDLLRLEGGETAIKGIASRENKLQNASKEQ
ncbi:hypothetical protein FOPG_08840 [Fusarium oxysporum f. sp. conglutinans race 2 54008]|jgi:hypothetical protein|uniref:Uncharacterized protein n=3 Tax=Fusarium oxysporum TaxID=5507 RepID=X0M0N6_FUSOX|nr:hypothetical protein FOVG_12011 [Fusarium oxysporum f. sp. pisi HDV247]EXL76377.1 hypothetical protein FOPG_08840 [Fusarium oxysporum f. sp. conglutinans race 2 54008]EXM27072.1 hypothetical protein FOTG_06481 [Fusarium oxysporum f. sp. vasinfectum 25433]